jgi:hypothetical protein
VRRFNPSPVSRVAARPLEELTYGGTMPPHPRSLYTSCDASAPAEGTGSCGTKKGRARPDALERTRPIQYFTSRGATARGGPGPPGRRAIGPTSRIRTWEPPSGRPSSLLAG